MRKSVIGLMAVALLFFAGQAGAQDNGTGDPLGLIAAGAIQPFWALGGNLAVVEITSPVGFNNDLHGIFFDANCDRDQSIPLPVTRNGFLFVSPDDIGVNFNGLLVIARSVNQTTLVPAAFPFHVRSQWANIGADFIREIDPISLQAAETSPAQTWNPMRSAASFANPIEGAVFHTEIFLMCPNQTILDVMPVGVGFPAPPPIAYAPLRSSALIVGIIYNDDEVPQRDIQLPCGCSSMFDVLNISNVYGNPTATNSLFYTELLTYAGPSIPATPNTFTGYRAITVTAGGIWPGATGDDFGRLNNGSAQRYQDINFSLRGSR